MRWEEGHGYMDHPGWDNTYHGGVYWWSPDDGRVVIVRGKDGLEGTYFILATDAETEAELAGSDFDGAQRRRGATEGDVPMIYDTLEEVQRTAERFLKGLQRDSRV